MYPVSSANSSAGRDKLLVAVNSSLFFAVGAFTYLYGGEYSINVENFEKKARFTPFILPTSRCLRRCPPPRRVPPRPPLPPASPSCPTFAQSSPPRSLQVDNWYTSYKGLIESQRPQRESIADTISALSPTLGNVVRPPPKPPAA